MAVFIGIVAIVVTVLMFIGFFLSALLSALSVLADLFADVFRLFEKSALFFKNAAKSLRNSQK